jgi:hypothetical protein
LHNIRAATGWHAGCSLLAPMTGPKKDVNALRAALFRGQYDGSSGCSMPQVRSRFGFVGRKRRVRLLNPDGEPMDRTSRRFALLEID